MTDAPVRTVVRTDSGTLPFQHYFVRDRCAPRVRGFEFEGATRAHPAPALREALSGEDLETIVVCPSNPFISVDPVLAVPGMRDAIGACRAPVVAVSPIVGGEAVKGPTAKMMRELGLPVTPRAVAEHYGALLDGFVVDEADAGETEGLPVPVLTARTLMKSDADKKSLAETDGPRLRPPPHQIAPRRAHTPTCPTRFPPPRWGRDREGVRARSAERSRPYTASLRTPRALAARSIRRSSPCSRAISRATSAGS